MNYFWNSDKKYRLSVDFFTGDQCNIKEGRAHESQRAKLVSLRQAETSEECIDMVKKYPDAIGMYWASTGWVHSGDDEKMCHAMFEKFDPNCIDDGLYNSYYFCEF